MVPPLHSSLTWPSGMACSDDARLSRLLCLRLRSCNNTSIPTLHLTLTRVSIFLCVSSGRWSWLCLRVDFAGTSCWLPRSGLELELGVWGYPIGMQRTWTRTETWGLGEAADSVQGPRRSWANAQGLWTDSHIAHFVRVHRSLFRPHGHFLIPLSRVKDYPR